MLACSSAITGYIQTVTEAVDDSAESPQALSEAATANAVSGARMRLTLVFIGPLSPEEVEQWDVGLITVQAETSGRQFLLSTVEVDPEQRGAGRQQQLTVTPYSEPPVRLLEE
ncbi:hypothetical protein GCM10009789_09440 [Kribbella sancticallisti]|uniref:Uncharacterized protein n=1 Tax=Kribbella sancticallisti TaxID=460087 RepID=A0ABN2CGD3_9ACTN